LCNAAAFVANLVYLTTLFLKPQDNTVELYELGALARGLDTQKKLAEEAFTIHSAATRRPEGYHDPEVGIFTYCSKGMGLCTSFCMTL
jgi:hypothetical protein